MFQLGVAKHFIEYLFDVCGIDLSSVSYHIRCNPAIAQQLPLEHIKWQTYTGIYIYQRLREMLFLFSFTFSYHNQLKFGRCDILHIHYNMIAWHVSCLHEINVMFIRQVFAIDALFILNWYSPIGFDNRPNLLKINLPSISNRIPL